MRVRIVPRKIRRNPSTPHIKRLNESGASDRASFVKRLGMAFKTPAKIDLHYDFGANPQVEVPPLSPPPTSGSMATTSANVSTLGLEFSSQSQLLDFSDHSTIQTSPSKDSPSYISLCHPEY